MNTPAESVLPTEQDEWNELASIGIVLDDSTTNAQLDAWASEVCRRIAEQRAEIERYNEAEAAEIARIQMRYAAMRDRHERRVQELEAIGRDLAESADFGSKKSRDVGFGTYGRRKVPESVKVVDKDAALNWAIEHAPDAVVEKIERRVNAAVVKPAVLNVLKSTGELPPGFEHTAAHDEPFVKVAE